MTNHASLTVIAGPTAVGKGTVVQTLRSLENNLAIAVSATTRSPREGEINGEHYFFLTEEEFTKKIAANEFIEWAQVHGKHRYGTLKETVLQHLDAGRNVLLEIDLQGARQVRESMPEAKLIFLAPPSWDHLVQRLIGRGTEDEEERTRRLETAKVEMAARTEFDYIVVNDTVQEAAREVARIISQ